MPLLSPPPTVGHADDLLASARTLLDDFAARSCADPAIGVTCGPACTACCHQAIPVTAAEVRSVVAAIGRLEPAQRTRIAARAEAAVDALGEAGIEAGDVVGNSAEDRRTAFGYFALGLACPLLDDGSCSIYTDRPLACREYLVASDPAHCWTIDTRPERVVGIRASVDVKTGFRRIAAELGEPQVSILAFALADALSGVGPPSPPETAPRSGPALATMLTPPRS